MSILVRASVIIDNKRLIDNDFSHISLTQKIGDHHTFKIGVPKYASRGMLTKKTQEWMGKTVIFGFGHMAEIHMPLQPLPNHFKGIITELSLSRENGETHLIVEGNSLTITAAEGAHTQSFENKTLQEIVEQVLAPYAQKIPMLRIEPVVHTKSIPYTVQYEETNFDFVARLAAKYGEWFYYDGWKLNFGKPEKWEPLKKEKKDDVFTAGLRTVVNKGLSYVADSLIAAKVELDCTNAELIQFELKVKTIPPHFKIKGYDYLQDKSIDDVADMIIGDNALLKKAYEVGSAAIFDLLLPAIFSHEASNIKELKRLIKRKEEAHISEILTLTGKSRNPYLKLGHVVHIKDSVLPEDYGEYIIISVTHEIDQSGDYHNVFEGIPKETKSPPSKRSGEIDSAIPQLAKVVALDDPEKLGRVRVKFTWQEDSTEISPWIRVTSAYTGAEKGIYFQPEIEDSVVVGFENNNPEKPYVLTGMYHGKAKPEFSHPKNDLKSIKTRGGHHILMLDTKDSETLTITSPKKMILQAGEEILIQTTKDNGVITVNAGASGTINIEKAKTVNLKAESLVHILSEEKISVISKKGTSVEASGSLTLQGGSVTIEAQAKTTVKGATGVAISSPAVVEVKGALIKLN